MFSLKGKLSRSAYIFQNLFLNIIGFRFLYYPLIVESFYQMKMNPDYKYLIQQVSINPNVAWALNTFDQTSGPSLTVILIKYLFIIPFRMIDIKRIKDIIDRELSTNEMIFIAVVFTLPYVDFFTTLGLSILPAFYFAKKRSLEKINHNDLQEAKNEELLKNNQKLFDSGKISRADFLKTRKEYTKK